MIEHRYADVNGIRMHYAAAGDGPLVLFLHGFPEYWGVWRRLLADLSKDHLAVAPDQRGYGETSRPDDVESYRMDHLTADLRALVDHLGKKKVSIVCQDWGGFVGWSFAMRYPDVIDKLVTINIGHPALFNEALRSNPKQQEASQYMLMFRSPGSELALIADDFAFLKQTMFTEALASGKVTEAEVNEQIEAWKRPDAIKAGLNWYRAAEMGPPDGHGSPGGSNLLDGIDKEAQQVRAPVLFILGEKDPYLLPDSIVGLEAYALDLTIKRIPDATHWVTMEKPELVSGWIREHLSR
jgi:pimeloyl-ACP methyl ester carboxylesterase